MRVRFTDFWYGEDDALVASRNPLHQLLTKRFDLDMSADPQVVIYSGFGSRFLRHRCTRIFYTGENCRPDYRECDFAFTFDISEDPRHYRLPLYKFYADLAAVADREVPEDILTSKTDFCCFLVSNPKAIERIAAFQALSKYKRVNSGGKVLNNVGARVADRRAFYRPHKFCIAFENESFPGYTTEKLVMAYMSYAIPIYC